MGGIGISTFKERISEEEFVSNYNLLKSSIKMGELYGVNKKTILTYAKEIGYVNHYRFEATDDQKKFIVDNYYKLPSTEIAELIGCSTAFVNSTWTDNGLKGKPKRTYHVDDNFFKIIDTPEKGYLLGYIAADGCVYKRENHIGMLSIVCRYEDVELLEMVNKYMNSNYRILNRDKSENKKYSALEINSDVIVDDLKKYNIVPRKTWTYVPVSLSNTELMWHFVRGYFDGDGSIYKTPNVSGAITPSSYRCMLCGNYNTMKWFQEFFEQEGIHSNMNLDKRTHKYKYDFYTLSIRRIDHMSMLKDKMYHSSEGMRLERKYNKFIEFEELRQLYC